MGILGALLGDQNPISQWASQNQNYLNTIGAGLGQGQNLSAGLGAGLANVPQAKALDFQAAEKQKADAKVEAQTNATKLWLRKNRPDIADMVDAGMSPAQGWTLANQSALDPTKGIAINGRLVNPVTGELMGNFSDPADSKQPYAGTSMDAQNWNIVLKAQANPSLKGTPEYQAAWSQLSQPRVTYQQTPQGVVPVMEQPNLPAGWGPNAAAQTDAPQVMSQPSGSPQVGGFNAVNSGNNAISMGSPLPGTAPAPAKPTEQQVRSGLLSDTLTAVAPTVLKNFDVLADPTGKLISFGGDLTNWAQSPEYQKASAAMASALQTIVFQLSGANTGTNEMQNTARSMTPAMGDKPETLKFKRDLFLSYIKSVADASNEPDKKAAAQAILDQAAQDAGGGGAGTGDAIARANELLNSGKY